MSEDKSLEDLEPEELEERQAALRANMEANREEIEERNQKIERLEKQILALHISEEFREKWLPF